MLPYKENSLICVTHAGQNSASDTGQIRDVCRLLPEIFTVPNFLCCSIPQSRLIEKFDVSYKENLTAECNVKCACSTAMYKPVCSGERTYFSPCHAGCKTLQTYISADGLTVRVSTLLRRFKPSCALQPLLQHSKKCIVYVYIWWCFSRRTTRHAHECTRTSCTRRPSRQASVTTGAST